MRQTVAKLAQSYTPMIRFIGKHPISKHTSEIIAHPCAVDGIIPGGKNCLNAGEFLKNLKPFVVVPYKHPKGFSTTGSSGGYSNRPLKDNEVSSISQLPARFRFKAIEEAELEAINNGGM